MTKTNEEIEKEAYQSAFALDVPPLKEQQIKRAIFTTRSLMRLFKRMSKREAEARLSQLEECIKVVEELSGYDADIHTGDIALGDHIDWTPRKDAGYINREIVLKALSALKSTHLKKEDNAET